VAVELRSCPQNVSARLCPPQRARLEGHPQDDGRFHCCSLRHAWRNGPGRGPEGERARGEAPAPDRSWPYRANEAEINAQILNACPRSPQSPPTKLGPDPSFPQNILALVFGRTHNLEISVASVPSDPSISIRGIADSLSSGQLFRSQNLARSTWHANALRPAAANRPPRPRPRPRPPKRRRKRR